MSRLDQIKKTIGFIFNSTKYDELENIINGLDDELDVLATKIYKIRKVALHHAEQNELTSERKVCTAVHALSDEILEIIGNSPRCSNRLPN